MTATTHRKTLNEFEMEGVVWNNYTTPEVLRRSLDFRFRPSDVCVCTFPRCGTTLTQEIVWQLVHRDTIKQGGKYAPIDQRFPFLEFNYGWGVSGPVKWGIDRLESAGEDEQRLIKTHVPYALISHRLNEAKPRVIAVLRNPKDCCNSLYHFYKGLEMYGPWSGAWDEFVDIFLSGKTMCGDYFQVSADWWQLRNEPNVLLLKYEDLVSEPADNIQRIAKHLGINPTEEQLACVMHNCKFTSMFSNDNLNTTFGTGFRFLRKGLIGDWKRQFTVAQSELFDRIVSERFSPLGLEFAYE
ncbi:hypothetical protein BOX15_Mlig013426g1 [Macrostomum lignano]|uniref:Sulfotransferase domain-containing protein n=2 Tax=Macrostomum lignano TaxID=282301 RepID=A0A267ERN6_9PLAT|nr:hypothetical protein BOX15_Mlig013426g1 [Macrostomum lignano]